MTTMLRMTPEQFDALQKRRKQPVAAPAEKPAKRPKYGNRKTEADGIVFDSAREARRYQELMLLYKAGEISCPQRQVTFPLPGKIRYVADFVYFEKMPLAGWPQQPVAVVEDCKGVRTKEYVMKRKLMLEKFGIAIRET